MSCEQRGDHLVLRGVRATGYHGVFDVERRDGQEFVVDVDLSVDLARPGRTDDLAHTVNYAEVAADVVARIEGPAFDLIERLAEVIAEDCVARPLVEEAEVTVHKPQAPVGVPFGDVEVHVSRRRPAVPVVIALGANLGDRGATLDAALAALHATSGLTGLKVSARFETDPVGGQDQPAYLNAVATGWSRLTPHHLLRLLHEIEADHGRTREIRWGARTLDLDLIQVGAPGTDTEVVSDDLDLTLPHPRAHERTFVLAPWADVDPGAMTRAADGTVAVADLLASLDVGGIRPWSDR